MDFSIVIPIYNSARYLPKTLKRIFNACQGFDYQVILVDDCSDEDDIKYIRQIAATNSNVMLHEKKQKSNAAVSRNLGTKLAQSEIVFFLDSDDYFTTNYIIRRMNKHEDRHIDIIFGNYAEVSGDSVRDFNFHYKSGSSGEDFLFLEMGDIRSSTISIRKKSDRRFLFPEFLNKHQDWGFLVNATNLGAHVAHDAGGGVFLDVGRYGRMTAKLNLEASDRFINTFLSPSDRHISGFACKHLLASLYSENAQAFNYYSSRIVRHSLSGKFKVIKWYGDCLARLGLFSVGGRLLRNVRRDSGDDMQARKVIIVIENIAGKGGTERVASGLANALARLPGYEVAVFSLFGERSFFPLASDVRLRCGGGDSLFWPWRLALALRRERADVIITVSMGKLSVVMTPFLRLFCARSRLLLSEHVSFHQYPRVFKWLKLLVYRLSDRVIFLTRQDSDAIARWVGAGKCRVIENVSPFGAQAPTPALQKKVALAVGRLSNQKGFDRLIALWRGVVAQAPDWRLLIIGDGPERDALRRQIEDAGLERQVSLLPATADVADYYRQASLYLMTSRYEGLPMVLIEAMSFGLPLVAYDCKTGPAELIDDGVNGYLVPDDDAAAFSEGVIKLMLDPGLREHFSIAALEKSRRFSPERIYPQWQQLTE